MRSRTQRVPGRGVKSKLPLTACWFEAASGGEGDASGRAGNLLTSDDSGGVVEATPLFQVCPRYFYGVPNVKVRVLQERTGAPCSRAGR
jgi:hypothetical protein